MAFCILLTEYYAQSHDALLCRSRSKQFLHTWKCSYLPTDLQTNKMQNILTFTVKMSMVWMRAVVDWLLVGEAGPSCVEFPVTNCCDFLVWPGEYADHLFEIKVLSGQCFGYVNNPIFGSNEQVLLPCQPYCLRIICRIFLAGKVLIS